MTKSYIFRHGCTKHHCAMLKHVRNGWLNQSSHNKNKVCTVETLWFSTAGLNKEEIIPPELAYKSFSSELPADSVYALLNVHRAASLCIRRDYFSVLIHFQCIVLFFFFLH